MHLTHRGTQGDLMPSTLPYHLIPRGKEHYFSRVPVSTMARSSQLSPVVTGAIDGGGGGGPIDPFYSNSMALVPVTTAESWGVQNTGYAPVAHNAIVPVLVSSSVLRPPSHPPILTVYRCMQTGCFLQISLFLLKTFIY